MPSSTALLQRVVILLTSKLLNANISSMTMIVLPTPASRQLLCFERKMRDTVDVLDAVKEIFRAMMPIFNNENKSIITPLLATGFQVSTSW